ncbi:hypothetical protein CHINAEXTREME_01200 [Halobiforma lacisalsi AJ5]|uniref:DUF2795 domain-containing protein n=1 Tax=Natronobacterium lacisalsi AJ5 TaxID=358396 RepID=M0LH57_NATLA|nr:hypothetical protein [Halobiforma lacisalsi]APW96465.1 hypothetical protein CHINAEXTREME_01200 [Halobiforma lacisalsi AJ5]EMA31764.1 hypothetical protein C445_13155 [Halobiforma lacisalsi AJ5]
MGREVKLGRVESTLEELDYPATRAEAATELEDVTVLLADGERNLGSLIEDIGNDRFESAEDLEAELHNVLPREAVGEPYQSEGEG